MAMFGNPRWFGKRGIQFTAPTTWRGWFYLAGWTAAIGGPAWVLQEMHRGPETLIWLAASGLTFLLDLRNMKRQAAAASARSPEPFVIDDQRDVTRLRTPPRRWFA